MTMQVMPIQQDQNGRCPSGYYSSGNMCVPSPNAKPAIPKIGYCPNGWYSSGNSCVASKDNPKIVIPKGGSCPVGYHAEGNYCVQN